MQALEIKVRARTSKEAINLGFMLARRHYFSLLLSALPCWTTISAVGAVLWWQQSSPLYLLLITWWLKPLYERPLLLRLSRLIFKQESDWRAEQKAVFAPAWLAEISYLRLFRVFAPIRHAVNCLEGLHGKRKRERLRFFAGGASGGGSVLLLLSLLESGLLCICLWQLFDLSYLNLAAFLQSLLHQPQQLHQILALFYALLSLLATPFYIGAGFMIYLNWRIISEGWAVALDMQALAARLMQCAAVCVCAALLAFSTNAEALTAEQAAADKAWVQAEVQGSSGPYEHVWRKNKHGDSNFSLNLPDGNFSQTVKFFLIAAAIVFLLWLFYHIIRGSHASALSARKHKQTGRAISRAEHRTVLENLAAAQSAAEKGELLRAVAILYAHWRQDAHLYRLPEMMLDETENDYWQRVQGQSTSAQTHFLQQLFSLWQQGAYAQQRLDKTAVLALLADYQNLWRQV